MKRILTAVALVLFSGGLLLANGQSSGSAPSISSFGTLLGLPSAANRSSLDALEHDGFSFSYKLLGIQKTVWARGADSGGLRTGQVNVDGNSASVIVTTEDGAWEITNSFTLDDQGELIIRRTLKNTSIKKLSLEMTEYLDSRLLGTSVSTQLRTRALLRVKTRGCNEQQVERPGPAQVQGTPAAERPAHDFCTTPVCPAGLASLSTVGGRVSLKWKCSKIVAPEKEAHFDTWVGLQNANQ